LTASWTHSLSLAVGRDLPEAQWTNVLLQHAGKLKPWVRLCDALDDGQSILEFLKA
jgi:hypothetical protein